MKPRFVIFAMILLMAQACFKIPSKVEEGKSLSFEKYSKMPEVAKECSGMVLIDEELVFLNDGGNGPYLHRLNKEGTDSLGSYEIEGTENVDWEALAMYKDDIVIGEFGNNRGARKDLKLYHLDKESKQLKRTIGFSYPDQEVFDESQFHDYDCEALVIKDDKYHLFSKHRTNKRSKIYTSNLYDSSFVLIDTITLEGSVTDAVYHEQSDCFILLCYEFRMPGFKNSLAIVKEQKDGRFKATNIFNIGPSEQFETLVHLEGNQFLIGSELGFLKKGRHLYLATIEGL